MFSLVILFVLKLVGGGEGVSITNLTLFTAGGVVLGLRITVAMRQLTGVPLPHSVLTSGIPVPKRKCDFTLVPRTENSTCAT